MAITPIARLSAAVHVGRAFRLCVARHLSIGRSAGQRAPAVEEGVQPAAEGEAGDREGTQPQSIPPASEYPIDLTTALRLAEAENPLIAEARQRVGEALALQLRANVLMLPTLNAGT